MSKNRTNCLNVYFTAEERAWINSAATLLGSTQSYVIRLLIRVIADLPVPLDDHGLSELAKLATIPATPK